MGRVVIGLDGSEHGSHALAWAAEHAHVTRDDLEVVTVATPPMIGDPMMGYWVMDETHHARIAQLQAEAVAAVGVDDLNVVCLRPEGGTSRSLLQRAEGADLLVVGTRGHGAAKSALLGSSTHQLATHTPCPLVVVPDAEVKVRRIVVGVDGSPSSVRAVGWAADLARARGATIELVAVFDVMGTSVASPWVPPIPTPDPAQIRTGMESMLEEVVGRADLEGVEVERCVMEGPASSRLRERAEGADLLVVGSRGRGGFLGLLLGSTSHGCLRNPPCAVAIIPGGDA